MVFSSIDDVVDALTIQLSTTATALTSDGLESAVTTAMTELGWSFPVNDAMQCMWILSRAQRHACYILWVASAHKFKYKQVNLQNRFEHYEKLIKSMDSAYENALKTQSNIFSSVSSYSLFGTLVGAGFVYDSMGRDLTYSDLENYINTGA